MKYLPNNLKQLKFDLSTNNIGANKINMKYYGDIIK